MKLSKKKIAISIVVIIGLTASLTFSPHRNIDQPQICIKESCFDISLANTPQQHEQGLMYVKHMNPNSGMLFIFDKQDRYTFWMKNTLIPLDMIRIDQDKKIVDIQSAKPCTTDICETYGGTHKAKYVLEINYGLSQKMGITTGQKVKINY